MKQKGTYFLLCFSFLFSSCTTVSVPVVTQVILKQKIDNLLIGDSKEIVFDELGSPKNFVIIPQESNPNIEIYGFVMGHYWKHMAPVVVFQNDRLVGVASDAYDLMHLLRTYDVLPKESIFWHYNPEKKDDERDPISF